MYRPNFFQMAQAPYWRKIIVEKKSENFKMSFFDFSLHYEIPELPSFIVKLKVRKTYDVGALDYLEFLLRVFLEKGNVTVG